METISVMERRMVLVGDYVRSSHGYRGWVVESRLLGENPGTVALKIELHRKGSGIFRSEIYDADVDIEVLKTVGEQVLEERDKMADRDRHQALLNKLVYLGEIDPYGEDYLSCEKTILDLMA